MNPISESVLLRKVTLRLIPFLFLLYIVAYLDRVNVGFAKLQFNKDLGFDEAIYGFGAGVFFLGYFLFEIPSNLMLERVGARKWIARIMVTWGLLAIAMMFTHDKTSFYALRFLLGLAEAGFFPGIILYLTYWFVSSERARIVALFMTAAVTSNIIGGPLSGQLLTIHLGGLKGWQWLFLLEGVPAVLLGFVVWFYLTDGPEKALWLSPEERTFLLARREADRQKRGIQDNHSFREAIANVKVWTFCTIYFLLNTGSYFITFNLPQFVKNGFHLTDNETFAVGLLTMIPFLISATFMLCNGWHSDHTGERRFHLAGSALVSAVGFLLVARFLNTSWPMLLSLSIAAMGVWGMLGPFWAMPTRFLRGAAAAGGIALINAVGNLGGFAGPYIMGELKKQYDSYTIGLYFFGTGLLVAALLAIGLRHETLAAPINADGTPQP